MAIQKSFPVRAGNQVISLSGVAALQ